MAYDPSDAYYEEAWDNLYEQFYESYRNSDQYFQDMDESIEEFKAERLKSFYVEKNPLVAEPAFKLLSEARELFKSNHFTAAQVFSGAATEVTFQDVLLKPIVYGFVHSDSVASMFTGIIDEARAVYKFKAILVHVVHEFAGIDLHTYKIGNSPNSLWQDLSDVRTHRNNALHKAMQTTEEAAFQSLSVASTLLESVFPAVINTLGLHLHEGIKVCQSNRCNTHS